MKKLLQTMKAFLVIAMLCVGTSAWADTETINVLSENYESYTTGDITSTMQSNGWTFQSKNGKNQINITQGTGSNTTKYFDFYYPDGGANRNQYWVFPSSTLSALTADNWTLTFSAALNPGTGNSNNRIDILGTKSGSYTSAYDGATNTLFNLTGTASAATTYTVSVGAVMIKDSENPITLTSGTWYKFTIKATNINTTNNTADIYVKITSYDGQTTILENTQANLSTSSIGTLKGLCWNSPRNNSRLCIDDVLLTKEVDASVCADPTYNLTGADGTSRKFTLACETVGSTIYYASSELEKGANGWEEYTAEVTTNATTIYAYAQRGNVTSEVINFSTGAGTEVTLNAPVITRSSNNTVTISSDQSDKVGKPTATIYYSYGGDPIEYKGAITIAADATISAYATATGYTQSATSSRAVALFPTSGVTQDVDLTTPVGSKNNPSYTSGSYSEDTKTASGRTYAAYIIDGEQWGTNVYFQTGNVWGLRNNGGWYTNTTSAIYLLLTGLKKGDIVVAYFSKASDNAINATYSEKYSYGGYHAYIVDEDGNVELGFSRVSSSSNNYFSGIYAYTHNITGTLVGEFDNSTDYLGDMTTKVTLTPGQSYKYKFVNYNSNGTDNWKNWVLPVYDANDTRVITVRSDNWEDMHYPNTENKYGSNAGCTSSGFDWNNFVAKMNGATVEMTVSFTSDKVFTMSSTITPSDGGNEWTYSYRNDYAESPISLTGSESIQVALSVSNSWLEVLEEGYIGSATMKCNAGKYGTFAAPFDVTIPEGVTTYTASLNNAKTAISLEERAETTIPAGTPVIIYSESGLETQLSGVVTTDAASCNSGVLYGALQSGQEIPSGSYVLQTQDGVQQFYKLTNSVKSNVNRCWIELPTDPADPAAKASLAIAPDDITGVKSVSANAKNAPMKRIVNGQLIIEKDGKQYNAMGQEK